jgi:hypothetical protein
MAVAAPSVATAEIKIQARVEATDVVGNPISVIPVGGDFELRAYVDDVRTSTPIVDPMGQDLFGTFAAYMDVSYDGAKVTTGGPVEIGDFFDALVPITIASPGFVRAGGAAVSLINPGSDEQLLFTAPLVATNVGTVLFSPSFFSDIFFEWLMYGDNDPVLVDEVQFAGYELTIVPEPATSLLSATALAAVCCIVWRRRRYKCSLRRCKS